MANSVQACNVGKKQHDNIHYGKRDERGHVSTFDRISMHIWIFRLRVRSFVMFCSNRCTALKTVLYLRPPASHHLVPSPVRIFPQGP